VAGFKEAAGDGGFFRTGRRGGPAGMRSDRGTWLPFEVIAAQFLEWLRESLVNGMPLSCRAIGPNGVCHMSSVFAFLKDESGATAIEYGLIAAGISIVIIASVNAVGSSLNTTFATVSTQLK
jgi:pilus assembly protein Flp/PilA